MSTIIILVFVFLAEAGSSLDKSTDVKIVKSFRLFTEKDILPKAPENLQYAFIRGEELMLQVGKSLGTRYKDQVPLFDPKVVHFSSTPVSRTRRSTQCLATGLFVAKDPGYLLNARFDGNKSPCKGNIDIHNADYDKSHVLHKGCTLYAKLKKQASNEEKRETSPMRMTYYKKLGQMIETIYHKKNFVKSMSDSATIYDTFQSWILDGQEFVAPDSISYALPVMRKAFQLCLWREIYSKTNMVQYIVGPILNQIFSEIHNMEDQKAITSIDRKMKIHFHGSHDITVSPLLWVISEDETSIALPGDTLIIEVTSDDLVQIYYYNPLGVDKDKIFRAITLKPLCGNEDCKLSKFEQALHGFIYDEGSWKKMCKNPNPHNYNRALPQDIDEQDLRIMDEALGLLPNVK
ncbi:uncharacterized protein LOC129004027 isoform X2 [Macrosteles quadrilineatus]|uniref:uncharacterized protein LOC129004027 isoform X2 n=1 Tax=Macrosteles quadrilineatus TaxID=74068 RepID=UPI0023E0E4F9|nr:uncharacterized protein LOC129004027 isoform X2 [Macrosteles quadrilineatus]